MKIRPFTESDRPAALALAPRLMENVNPWSDQSTGPVDTVEWMLDQQTNDTPMAVFVAEDDEGFAGMVKVFEKGHMAGEREAYVDGLAVEERVARQGLGTELMEVCEDWARKRGHKWVHIETPASNQVARDFYGAIGYGEEVVKLSKEI
ncbi:GNAT family N-acetyltransferase [Epidermidibacterium keratini]|uniref:GNAT family N-acetyltransferase n=1 Tax=Epidermidibacterium keratini TaxID=1891644 RepID=A0A7L4YPN5_9ACTN|nr:GNAT family N-acetyltransferase [Epidermidibacterium keratini]QHC01018.1 GNAT family N-acetyltransferase [Epidermidibacterium keratini]